MTVEATLFTVLNALAPAGGVAPDISPDSDVCPRIVYSRISTVPNHTLLGDAPAISEIRMQIDVYATTKLAARALAASVRAAMVAAALARTLQNTCGNDADLYEAELKQYRATIDFMIQAQEP